jgi:hypothetical protein
MKKEVIKRTQSYTECTQSFTENMICASRMRLPHRGHVPARSANKNLLSETLCALCVTLCPHDDFGTS